MACTTASSQAKTPIQFSGTIDYGAARYVNGASTPIKNVLNGKLHDCIEDTAFGYDQIKEQFGESVADLVNGVTRLGRLHYSKEQICARC